LIVTRSPRLQLGALIVLTSNGAGLNGAVAIAPAVATAPTASAVPAPSIRVRPAGAGDRVDGSHHGCRCRLLDHVPFACERGEIALRNVAVKPRRLLLRVDQAILLAGDDRDGHFQ
jgi:hypothetical protein